MPKPEKGLPACTTFRLGKAFQRAHSIFKARLKPYGLTNVQYVVLEGLWFKTGVTAAELGKALILDKATLSVVLERMDDAGWIEKSPDPDDGRIQRIFPTKKALDLKDELVEQRSKANQELTCELRPEETILLNRFLWDLL